MKNTLCFFLFVTFFYSSCIYENNDSRTESDVTELFDLMQGSFNSRNQSLTDSNYYDITLHMYPIWDSQKNFIYVEQSVSSMQEKPYRQRIYEIKRSSDSTFTSVIYKFPNDSSVKGKTIDVFKIENLSGKFQHTP